MEKRPAGAPTRRSSPNLDEYAIYSKVGGFIKRVRNARNPNEPDPVLVSLPPGLYEIQAEAEVTG